MVLRKSVLGELIRATAVNAHELFGNAEHILPSQPRLDLIKKIYSSCKQIDTLESFYCHQFSELNSDSVSPLQLLTRTRASTDPKIPEPVPLPPRSEDEEATKRVCFFL